MKYRVLLLLTALLVTSISHAKPKKLKTGLWYASFKLTENDNLPFIIDVNKEGLFIINGDERIQLNDIQHHSDSIFVSFPAFASELRFKVHNKQYVSGRWYNHAKKGNYYLPFWSKYKIANRYPCEPSQIDVNGKWEVTFDYKTKPEKAIGIFKSVQVNSCLKDGHSNSITGTFLTETGDYRYLDGATVGDSLYLSTFDGSHAFLFSAKFSNDTLWGQFLSGNHYKTSWFAVKNDNFELSDPDSLTYLVNHNPITFSLPNVDGGTFNYPADATKNKVTLIQILGTWCPNCLDESQYLKELRNTHGDKLDIIAIAFETQKNRLDKIEKVNDYRRNLSLDYTFLIGGSACKSCASDLFPMINEIISFPTLLFIDKKGVIRKIHTGFSGPGTGEYYDKFVSSTNSFVETLINE